MSDRSEGEKASGQELLAPDQPEEQVLLASLIPHPENYLGHPEDQIQQLVASIRDHGAYRNIVIAKDGTILAGHGVVMAMERLGRTHAPARRMPYARDDPRAIRLLVADNEVSRLAERDDRALSNLLKRIQAEEEGDLAGTGYDEEKLAALAMVTRPASEIQDANAAAEWASAGMPAWENVPEPLKMTISFRSEKDRQEFLTRLELGASTGKSTWWPERERRDMQALRFEDTEND